jgi:hypothetical protein
MRVIKPFDCSDRKEPNMQRRPIIAARPAELRSAKVVILEVRRRARRELLRES